MSPEPRGATVRAGQGPGRRGARHSTRRWAGVFIAAGVLAGCPSDAPQEDAGASTSSACEQGGSTTAAIGSADAVEGPIMPTEDGDPSEPSACILELVYGPCVGECRGPDRCFSFGRMGMDYSVCGVRCDDVLDCPPAPNGEALICHNGGCFVDCDESLLCPDGMRCATLVGTDADEAVCMWDR